MELSGALSNPFIRDKILQIRQSVVTILTRKRRRRKQQKVLPRTRIPLLATITQVLELANHEPLRVKEIYERAQELLGKPISYRSLKTCLSNHHGLNGGFYRVSWGRYCLQSSQHEQDRASSMFQIRRQRHPRSQGRTPKGLE